MFDGQGWRNIIASENLVFFEVNVNGMGPIAGDVGEYPVFGGVQADTDARFFESGIHELAVDGPLAVQAIKAERANDARVDDRRKIVELHLLRLFAVVANGMAIHVEAKEEIALTCGQNFRPAAFLADDRSLAIDLI